MAHLPQLFSWLLWVSLKAGWYDTTTPVAPAPFNSTQFRFNEGICDARGRFDFTLADGLVATEDRSDLHNGTAWSADGRLLYLSHSNQNKVDRYEYDLDEGTLAQRQPYVSTHTESSVPDGAAMDEEGCYWCAIHGAGALHRYDPDGRLLAEVTLPISQPTMCTFAASTWTS